MDIKQAEEQIRKNDWYKQGAAGKVFYFSFPWYTCNDMKILGEKIKSKYDLIFYINKHIFDIYISQKSLKKTAEDYFSRQLKDRSFIKNLYKNWRSIYVKQYLKETKKISNIKIDKLKNEEFVLLFNEFSKSYRNVWSEVMFLDGFDFYGMKILERILGDIEIDLSDLEILLSPPNPSMLQEEREKLLKIATYLKKEKIDDEIIRTKNIAELEKKYPLIYEKIVAHSNEYYWLHNDYASVEFLTSKYFFKSISSLLKNEKKYEEEKEIFEQLKNLKKQKREIIKKYKLSSEKANLLEFMSILGNLRDERKSYNQMAGNTLRKILIEIGRRNKIEYKYLEDLFFWEISGVFNLNRKYVEKISQRREQCLFYVTSTTGHTDFFRQKALKLIKYLDGEINKKIKLEGMPAFKGVVKGKVKIIKNKNDFQKMKKGDILVAPNTRPEFLPVMKMAGAIITEEGGITCHAAIVSRELKIPAIVGVQGIISVLKDDDVIKVDAERGKIEILKN